MGGVHYDLSRSTHTINPFDRLDDPACRHQAAQWLHLTLALGGETLSAGERELVRTTPEALSPPAPSQSGGG